MPRHREAPSAYNRYESSAPPFRSPKPPSYAVQQCGWPVRLRYRILHGASSQNVRQEVPLTSAGYCPFLFLIQLIVIFLYSSCLIF
ncbi:hypothetical protein D9M68_848800 [compost metagenome]